MGEINNRGSKLKILQTGSDTKSSVVTDIFSNYRGLKLYSRYWTPKSEVKGLVFLCHGFGEHLGWYDGLARHLCDKDLLVFGHDHQGHGRSEGRRVFVEEVDDYVQDVIHHCVELKAAYPSLPMFLYGHSMGGMIAVYTVMRNAAFFAGMVLEGPLIIPDPHEVTPTKLLLGRLISPLLPELQMGRVRVEQVTSDTDTQSRLVSDKLRWTGGVKLGLGMAFLRCLETIHKSIKTVNTPFLVIHGDNDSLCQPAGSHLLAREAASKDKKIKIYPGASHHLILEVESVREQVLEDVRTWIVDRLNREQGHKITSL